MEDDQYLNKEKGFAHVKDTLEPEYKVEVVTRYYSKVADFLDFLCYNLMLPWTTSVSNLVSCYITREGNQPEQRRKVIEYFLLGPIYALFSLIFTLFGIFGTVLWCLVCVVFDQEKYTYMKIVSDLDLAANAVKTSLTDDSKYYTFCSANVILAPEFICKINNVRNSKMRAKDIAQVLVNHTGKHLFNLELKDKSYKITSKLKSIESEFPAVDFLCLQEVWERSYALILIEKLKEEFKHFIYDIGEFSWSVNRCALGSGLMFASKRPVLKADFKTFTHRTKHAKYTSQGVLCVKVLLEDLGLYRRVGFVSNLHAQAFQGTEPILPKQVTEAYIFIHMFKHLNTEKTDIVDFDIICGDFNADNMSPGDADIQYHPIFKEYQDVCVETPGKDHRWAIGTEMRQSMMHSLEVTDAEDFKKALIDDSRRRKYILDADVIINDHYLRTSVVEADSHGHIRPVPWGGMRRVDKILYNVNTFGSKPVGYCFVTGLTNLTDHIPVCLTVGTK